MASGDAIQPFAISVSDEVLHELSEKLKITRLPDELELRDDQKWDWGIPLSVLRPIVDYWRTEYDWRAVEDRINKSLPQFIANIDSLDHGLQQVHFVHKRSADPKATPLLFIHGWPGNFLEVSKMIDELTSPKDINAPSFHVVAPSLPGYVFSQRASTPGMEAKASAFIFDKLMSVLGYQKYIAQGGDWGSLVCRALAVHHQGSCVGTHINMMIATPPSILKNPWMTTKIILGFMGLPGGIAEHEVNALKGVQQFQKYESAYAQLQGTKPQTLAVGLTDSPVGLLAWITEKLYVWTDNYPWTPEEIITWTMLYISKGPAGGLRYYKENGLAERVQGLKNDDFISMWSPTPLGWSMFPKEVYRFPEEWATIIQNHVYTGKHERGGHFAAWEVPELLLEDIRKFAIIVASGGKPASAPSYSYSALLAGISIAACGALALSRFAPRAFSGRT
ncbi:epoxide hydrolase [Ceratobasidium sp. AG-Ba]|nr:epoxide hydrolase [Ceratobasidium sp. AG-Ba]